MSGAILPLPQYASWCGVQLKHRDTFTFTFTSVFFMADIEVNKFYADCKISV